MKLFYATLLICQIVQLSGEPVTLRKGSQEMFVSEVIRVRRQAGYVYSKPSISFDLPTRAPSLTVTTQAPTVDRTQAQMMYYAYPVPATGSNAVNIAASSGAAVGSGGGSAAAASAGNSGGYNYGSQKAASASAQFAPNTGSYQTGSGSVQSSSVGSSGYSYNANSVGNAPISTGSLQQTNGAGSSGYGYNAPSAGAAQTSNGVESTQTSNAGSSQVGSNAGSGYEYSTPISTQTSGATAIDASTNAPQYLPPPGGENSNNILPSPGLTKGETSGTSGTVTVSQPLDQYLPPLIGKTDLPAAPIVDQYLPPNRQSSSSTSSASSSASVNQEVNSDSGFGPNSNYLAPDLGQSSLPVTNVTPRPFSSGPLSDGYLPPVVNSPGSAPNLPSTPASPYLPPVL